MINHSNKQIYLTFDLDWCAEEVLSDTMDILEKEKIKSTFFITHATPLLERMRDSEYLDLGIHPNFNISLDGKGSVGGYKRYIEDIIKIVPEAKCFRSHSLTINTQILNSLPEFGITHEVNLYIPFYTKIQMNAFRIHNDLIRVPFFYEDDLHCIEFTKGLLPSWEVKKWFENDTGLKLFNFHPIHVYLNTEHLSRYENLKEYQANVSNLKEHQNYTDFGTRDFLYSLIRYGKENRYSFKLVKEIEV